MKKQAVAGLVLAVIIVAVVSYWFTTTPTLVAPPKTTATTTAPRKVGGTMTLGLAREPNSLDPTSALSGVPQFTGVKALFDCLVTPDFDGKIKPNLAESYERVDDLTYVFHLRKGVKFHDGTPFNASCVLFMDWYIRKGPGMQLRVQWETFVKSVEALDDYTVKYTLTKKYPPFLYDLVADLNVGTMVSPSAVKKWGQEFGTHPVGTGPFKFVEWVKGSSIKLVANDDYWQGRPTIDTLIIKIVSDAAVRIMELQLGTVQFIEVPLTFASQLKRTPGVKLHTGLTETQYQLSWVLTKLNPAYKSYFTDKRVRQAINYAVNKQEIVDTVLDGWGVVSVGVIRYGFAGYAPYLAKYNYNVTKAKGLLAEAGYPNGFECGAFILESKDYRPYAEGAAVLIKSQLAKVGIGVNIEVLDNPTFLKRRYQQEFDLAIGVWTGGVLPSRTLRRMHSREAGPGVGLWNWENIRDVRLDYLQERLEETPPEDTATVKVFTDEMQRIVIEEAYECPLFDQYTVHATTATVQGYNIAPVIGVTIWAPNIGVKVSLNQTSAKQSAPMVAGMTFGSAVHNDLTQRLFLAPDAPREEIAPALLWCISARAL